MKNLLILENKYLMCKVAYYNIGKKYTTLDGGEKEYTLLMEDAEFDALEKYLTEQGSTVVKQVGTKVKDFNFKHPTLMLSLAKLQFAETIDGVDYKIKEFGEWLSKKALQLGIPINEILLGYSNKWDGHSINCVYTYNGLNNAITRGEGDYGNDLSDRLQHILPKYITEIELSETDVLEIRCELVIDKNLFKSKYEGKKEDGKYSNPRNYMGSVLSPIDYDINKIKELTVKPIHFILNGEHISPKLFENNNVFKHTEIYSTIDDYEKIVKQFEKNRESNNIQLDGIVVALPIEYRSKLGVNNHDPNWSISLKFVTEIVSTKVNGLDWRIGKLGQLTPVAMLEPVRLLGTTVRRASCYNLNYVNDNKIGIDAIVSVRKSGEIIPEIMSVIIPATKSFTIIDTCPACANNLTIEGVYLMCKNDNCSGRRKKQFASSLKKITIKGVGAQSLAQFTDFNDLIDIIIWVRENGNTPDIEKYGIIYGSKSHENFVNAFNNLYEVSLSDLIASLGYANVGESLSTQVAMLYCGLTEQCDFKGHTKELVKMFENPEIKDIIMNKKKQLEDIGIVVKAPTADVVSADTQYVVLTGSPKPLYKTKEDFLLAHPNLVDVGKLSDKRCTLLISDDLNSGTSKISDAKKRNIEIKTYGDF